MNDFNVVAVQKDLSVLVDTFEEMQDTEDFVLIDGCVSKLIIGRKEVDTQFDKMLYSYDKNILILIMKDAQLSVSDIEEFMHNKNIRFSKYVCDKQEDFCRSSEKQKEFSFVGERDYLKEAILDSRKKGFNDCVYYPNVSGKLELGYLTADGKYGLFGRMKIDGVVDFDDKMLLLLERQKSISLNDRQVFDLLTETSVRTLVDVSANVNSFKEKNKQLIKNS